MPTSLGMMNGAIVVVELSLVEPDGVEVSLVSCADADEVDEVDAGAAEGAVVGCVVLGAADVVDDVLGCVAAAVFWSSFGARLPIRTSAANAPAPIMTHFFFQNGVLAGAASIARGKVFVWRATGSGCVWLGVVPFGAVCEVHAWPSQ